MELRITQKALAIAAICSACSAHADERNDQGLLYRLSPVSPGATTFRFSWGQRASLVGYRDAVGILLFNQERAKGFHVANSEDSGEWLALSNFAASRRDWHRDYQEGTTSGLRVEDAPHYSRDDYSRRWFIMPSPNWVLQFTRGHLSNLDQLEAPKNIQRTAFSATYREQFETGMWQTTFAWGRHSSNSSPNTTGYLAESILQLAKVHTIFGRVEKVRSEDVLPNNSVSSQSSRLNKLTAGYYYDLSGGTGNHIDVGGMVSRYSAPANMASTYGRNPTSVFLFVRMQLP